MSDAEKLSVVERLEQLLNDKDAELEEMQQRVQEAEANAEADHTWTRHVTYEDPKTAPSPELPIPRLEMRWLNLRASVGDGMEVEAVYSLVYRHLLGWTVFVPLGRTRSSGTLAQRVYPDGKLDTPFRDGEHFRNEMKQLGLPGFVIVGKHVETVKP